MLKKLAADALRGMANKLDPPIELQPLQAEFELADRQPQKHETAAEPKRGSVAWRIAKARRGVLH